MSGRRKRGGRGAGLLPDVAVPDRGVPRRLRVERDLHQQLDIALRTLRDNRVSLAIITRVELTDDLAFARVYVRAPLDTPVDPKALIKTLKLASSRLRREIGKGMALRKAPDLRFIHDSGVEAAERVEALLAEIRAESPPDEDEPADGAAEPSLGEPTESA